MTGMHVLSTKLIPVHCPKQARFKNIVMATKHRGITSTNRLYEKVLGLSLVEESQSLRFEELNRLGD